MAGCVFLLGYSMGAVRISHHGEMLVVFDQFIHKRLAALIMDVIIRCSVNKKQVPLQLMGKGNGEPFL